MPSGHFLPSHDALGHGLTGPNLNSLIARQTAEDRQGATLGLSQGIGSLARALAPPIGGLAFDLGPSWPYWFGAAILVVIAFLALLVRPAQERVLGRIRGASTQGRSSALESNHPGVP